MYTNKLSNNRPQRTFTPVAHDPRMKDPYFTSVYYTHTVSMCRFRTQEEADRYLVALEQTGLTLWDPLKREAPEPVANRYIVVNVPEAGQVIVDIDKAEAVKTYTDTPAGRRAAAKYLEKLNG